MSVIAEKHLPNQHKKELHATVISGAKTRPQERLSIDVAMLDAMFGPNNGRRIETRPAERRTNILTHSFPFPTSGELPFKVMVDHALSETPQGVREQITTTIVETAYAAAGHTEEAMRTIADKVDETLVGDASRTRTRITRNRHEAELAAADTLRTSVAGRVVSEDVRGYFATLNGTAPNEEVQQLAIFRATELTKTIVGALGDYTSLDNNLEESQMREESEQQHVDIDSGTIVPRLRILKKQKYPQHPLQRTEEFDLVEITTDEE